MGSAHGPPESPLFPTRPWAASRSPFLLTYTYAISVPHFWQNFSPGWTGEEQLGQDLALMLSSATGATLLARLASGITGCGCGAGGGVRTRAS